MLFTKCSLQGYIVLQARDTTQWESFCLVVLWPWASSLAPCRGMEVRPQGTKAKLEGVCFLAWGRSAALLWVERLDRDVSAFLSWLLGRRIEGK